MASPQRRRAALTPPPEASALAATVELHLDALYERAAAGLILRTRASVRPPPRIHLVRTIEGNRWLLSAALPLAARASLDSLLAAEPVTGSIEAMEHRPPACREAVFALLAESRPPTDEYRGPAFTFPASLPASAQPIELRPIPEAARPHPDLAGLASFVDTDRPVVVARDADGSSVALCHSARIGPASAEAGLEVVEAYRRRGLARAVTLGWAEAIRVAGRVPLYGTWWGNEASRATARSLDLVPYAEDWHVD